MRCDDEKGMMTIDKNDKKKRMQIKTQLSRISERTSLLFHRVFFQKKKEKEKDFGGKTTHFTRTRTHTPLHHHGARAGIDAPVLLLCLLRRRLRWGGELLREQQRRRRVERRRRGGGGNDDDDDEDECERD